MALPRTPAPPPEPTPTPAPARRASPVGLAAVFAAVCGFALLNLLVKLSHASAVVFAFYRLWLGALAMVVASLVQGRTRWRELGQTVPAGVLFGLNIVLFFSALKRTSVADVLIIGALQPALTLLVAGRMFGEHVTAADVAWTFVSLGGVVLVVLGSSGSPVWSLRGDLLAVGALIAFTVYFLLSKRIRTRLSAVEYMTGVTLAAAAVVTPVAVLSSNSLAIRPVDAVWLVVFVMGAQGGHVLLAWAHQEVDVSVSSLLVLAEPIIAAVGAFLVLHEPLAALEVAGALVVVAGMGMVARRATRVTATPVGPDQGP